MFENYTGNPVICYSLKQTLLIAWWKNDPIFKSFLLIFINLKLSWNLALTSLLLLISLPISCTSNRQEQVSEQKMLVPRSLELQEQHALCKQVFEAREIHIFSRSSTPSNLHQYWCVFPYVLIFQKTLSGCCRQQWCFPHQTNNLLPPFQ